MRAITRLTKSSADLHGHAADGKSEANVSQRQSRQQADGHILGARREVEQHMLAPRKCPRHVPKMRLRSAPGDDVLGAADDVFGF